MKVKDLVAELLKHDQELPVCLADWNEGYRAPSEAAAEYITMVAGEYDPNPWVEGAVAKFVCIGQSPLR